jgi:hypothetical protein
MVKHVDVALCLVNRCLLLCNIFETLGHLCKRIILCLNNQILHLFCHDESPYM